MSLLTIDLDLSRQSWYAATARRDMGFAPLASRMRCDVAVVGGGLAGLSAALELAERGMDVVLLEARQVAWGASGRNGGQFIHGLACDIDVVERQLGVDDARRIWAMTLEAIDLLHERCHRHGIDCDMHTGFLGVATSARKGAALSAWADRLERVHGYALGRIGPSDIGGWIASPRYHSGIHDPRSGHLHPLKYAIGLARAAVAAGVKIFEQSAVTALGRAGPLHRLGTGGGEVMASHVLLAGNVYLQGLAPALEARVMPAGTYIACTEPLDQRLADSLIRGRAAVCDTDVVLDYFRITPDHRLLFGGLVSYSTATPRALSERMGRRIERTFPQLAGVRVEYTWGGFVDITMNRAPDFGRIAPDVYYLQGFSGHGLALTGLAGRLVAEAICGGAERFDVFARLKHRPFPGGRRMRMPALALGMLWYRLRDLLA